MRRLTKNIFGLLLLAAGWIVLLADSPRPPPPDYPTAGYSAQYEFQTNCMGELKSGLLRLDEGPSFAPHYESTDVSEEKLAQIRERGLNVRAIRVGYEVRGGSWVVVAFDFFFEGKPVDAPSDSHKTFMIYCTDPDPGEKRTVHKNINYLCKESTSEHPNDGSKICELKLTYQPRE